LRCLRLAALSTDGWGRSGRAGTDNAFLQASARMARRDVVVASLVKDAGPRLAVVAPPVKDAGPRLAVASPVKDAGPRLAACWPCSPCLGSTRAAAVCLPRSHACVGRRRSTSLRTCSPRCFSDRFVAESAGCGMRRVTGKG